jgi:hypothetical protein
MHKLAMTMAASAAILCLSSIGWSANAMTGPGPAKGLPGANATPRQEAACQGWGPRIVRQDTSAGAAPVSLPVPPLPLTGEPAMSSRLTPPFASGAPRRNNRRSSRGKSRPA